MGKLLGWFETAVIGFIFLAACVPTTTHNHEASASRLSAQANPVIFIPGMLGSRLQEVSSGDLVWGRERSLGLYPQELEASRRMAVPFLSAAKAPDRDDIRAVAVLDEVRPSIFGFRLTRRIYSPIVSALKEAGYNFSTEDNSIPRGFQFPFDWRRDSIEAAVFLDAFIREKKAEVEAERRARFGDAAEPVKFDIVSHSLGGLILRYYMMYGGRYLGENGVAPSLTWQGADNIEKVIYVAPPHGGSVKSLTALLNGRDFGFRQPVFDQVIMSTYLATFQLLPHRGEVVLRLEGQETPLDIYDPAMWRQNRLGPFASDMLARLRNLMPDAASDEARYEAALTHVTAALSYADAFHKAIDAPSEPPGHLRSFLVTGANEETGAVLTLIPATGLVEIGETADGDGSVTHASSWHAGCRAPREACSLVYEDVFVDAAEHLAVTQTKPVAAKIREWLSSAATIAEN